MEFDWWHHPHHHRPECQPRPLLVTVSIKDAAGNVRAVADAQTWVRECHCEEGER